MMSSPVMVDVLTCSYNHEDYIRECIEGVLGQQTNFKFRYYIGDDCSKDGTRDILKEYQTKYPDTFFPIFHERNLGAEENAKTLFDKVEAKYIAIVDGDDYWSDPLKLQKQIDFLESNPTYSVTGHSVETLDDHGAKKLIEVKEGDFTFRDLMIGMNIPTLSMVFKNIGKSLNKELSDYPAGDFYIKSFLLNMGKGYLFKESMGVYRVHHSGFWSTQKQKLIHKKTITAYRKFLKSFPEQRRDIIYGTVKYKQKYKLFFNDLSKYIFWDILMLFRIGIKKISS